MRFRIADLFKRLFGKQQPFKQPERKDEPTKEGGAFQPRRKAPRSRWIITHNRIVRTHTKKVQRRRVRNKIARKSRQINRAA